jgi:hypothetical protein
MITNTKNIQGKEKARFLPKTKFEPIIFQVLWQFVFHISCYKSQKSNIITYNFEKHKTNYF